MRQYVPADQDDDAAQVGSHPVALGQRATGTSEAGLPARRLSELAEGALRSTAECCGAVATASDGTDERPTAVTHPDLAALVSVQDRFGDGPIPAAEEGGDPVDASDLLNDRRWPDYRALALDSGVRSSVTLPFRSGGLTVTLSLYSFRAGSLEAASHGPIRALGDLAASCLVRDRSYQEALTEVDQLGSALRSRPVVDQACGIVMHVLGCAPDDAFGVLRRISQRTNRKLADVASAVVERRGRGLEREFTALAE
ncbi:ANTAR domain-containing protein [Streptomyces sp. NPDC002790]|uniref:ANTAR domain-containing response regulator n=1 Tax=Streptomyces sp. NPDC002790 TaxID=3154431 RepID=UPI00332544D5